MVNMSLNTEAASRPVLDKVKIAIAIAIIIAAIAGFYVYEEQSQLTRVMGLLVAIGIAAWVFMQSSQGKAFWEFSHSAQIEVRKVIWPTRQETGQTTLLVIFTVIVAALFFWLLDSLLGKLIRLVIGG